ncbi:MAG TPA: S9 family peptidase [Gemmatimonadales bacterium]|nr:S9 family peptidase [Gemmatimonadales bacterium]
MRRAAAGAGLVAVLASGVPAAAGAQRPSPGRAMTIADFLSLRAVSDPQISPDGRLVAFVVTTASLSENKNVGRIWVVASDGSGLRQASGGAGSDRAPRWSPDGATLGFVSTRDGSPQVWRVSARGGKPAKLTALPRGVSDFAWSRDGKSLVVVSDLPWPPDAEPGTDSLGSDARIWTELFYRHWDEWRAGRRQHVLRVGLADSSITDLTPFDRDVPTLALGGKDVALAPSGGELAVVYNPDSVVATSTNNDIFLLRGDGGAPQPITTSRANDHSPAYSPDGRAIAYLAMSVPGFEADRQQLMLYEPAGGSRRSLTADWDRSVGAIAWAPDGKSLLAQVEERGEQVVYRIDAASGARKRVVSGGSSTAVQVSPRGDFIVFLRQTATAPPDLWRASLDGGGLRQLTRMNQRLLAGLDLGRLEPYGFEGAGGDSVFGWIMTPPGFDPARRYPVLFLIHGGPQGAWDDEWHPRWNYAMFAARGYVAVLVNFHGSTGYGQAFTNAISEHWGDVPYEDLMRGLDAALERPYVDPDRVAAAGASYGGYMIYWIAGHTNRFRALVAHDGVFNPRSMFGTTEELWFPTHEFGGTMLDSAARRTMERWSPANFVDRWATPMLVVHGQRDYRVDVSEGFQAFTALKLRGVPAKFLYFPDEGHFVLKPRNRRLWWSTVLDWIDSHLSR